jgi:hypothetical protein
VGPETFEKKLPGLEACFLEDPPFLVDLDLLFLKKDGFMVFNY